MIDWLDVYARTVVMNGALEYEIGTELLPWELRGNAPVYGPDPLPRHDEILAFDRHRLRVAPLHDIEPQQLGDIFGVELIVDCDELVWASMPVLPYRCEEYRGRVRWRFRSEHPNP
jgi:hypothetical protein